MSYANAAPTGVASEAEYLEIGLAAVRDPEELRAQLDESLPDGLDIIDAVEVRTPNFVERLEASAWQVRLDGVTREEAASAIASFLAEERVEVERLTKNGVRVFDARGAVAALELLPSQVDGGTDTEGEGARDVRTGRPCAILRLVVRHATPAVRPDDVLSGLRATADLAPPVPAEVTRLAQGPLDEETGTVTDPLALDRAAAPAVPLTAAEPRATASA